MRSSGSATGCQLSRATSCAVRALALAADAAMGDVFGTVTVGELGIRLELLNPAQLQALIRLQEIKKLAPGKERAGKTAAWWTSLAPEVREHLKIVFPGSIGALDGIPARDRDYANRKVLALEKRRIIDEIKVQGDRAAQYRPGDPTTGPSPDTGLFHDLQEKLDGIKAIESRLSQAGKEGYPEEILLLGFDTEGIGKAIVSFGNPDTADNIATYVPGLDNRLAGFGGNMTRAQLLWDRARDEASGQRTASIAWLDYSPPQADASIGGVTIDERAEGAIEPLGGFMRGLDAAHTGDTPAHTTVIAHSYGSLAAGKTAVEYPRLADELAFVGSPGVGVTQASELGIRESHVYAGAADDDFVTYLPPPLDPDLSGVVRQFDPRKWVWDTNPARNLDFGAKRFTVEPGGHSAYWNDDSRSLVNLAKITVGTTPNA